MPPGTRRRPKPRRAPLGTECGREDGTMPRRYWLMKSEPDVFGWEHLLAEPEQSALWDGVRNYQARNLMREMKVGDRALFYHSSTKPPHVVAVMEIVREAVPDPTQFDPESPHYDPKSDPDDPRWWAVTVKAVARLKEIVTLDALKANPKLAEMRIVQRNQRLSVQPATRAEFDAVIRMGGGVAG